MSSSGVFNRTHDQLDLSCSVRSLLLRTYKLSWKCWFPAHDIAREIVHCSLNVECANIEDYVTDVTRFWWNVQGWLLCYYLFRPLFHVIFRRAKYCCTIFRWLRVRVVFRQYYVPTYLPLYTFFPSSMSAIFLFFYFNGHYFKTSLLFCSRTLFSDHAFRWSDDSIASNFEL